jgi:hypothetical protein
MKFKVEYKDFPEWNETIEAYSWQELVTKIGCSATKVEVVDENQTEGIRLDEGAVLKTVGC